MTLYRHYKNMLYRSKGLVRHSETLESMVFYEALYDNPKGKLWVRPEAMFFEHVEVDGQIKPRFAKVDISYPEFTSLSPELRSEVEQLCRAYLPHWKAEQFESRLRKYPSIHVVLAKMEGSTIGFILGYKMSEKTFYSWLGGVAPEYRSLGIASRLIEAQESWCLEQGFTQLQTKCLNDNQSMIQLNSRHRYLITSLQMTDDGIKLVFEKKLGS